MTISPSLKSAQTQPVMVAKTTASAWPGSWSRNWAIGVRKTNDQRDHRHREHDRPERADAERVAGARRGLLRRILVVVLLDESSSSSATPKVRIIVPGFESRWMTWVTRPVRKKSSA